MKKSILFFCVFLVLLVNGVGAQTRGDVNDDGVVDIVDAMVIAQAYVSAQNLVDPAIGDVSGDGVLNILDALLIAQFYVGLIDVFPVDNLSQAVEVLSSELEREEVPQVSAEDFSSVVGGINQFAYDFYRKISDGDENVFFSPVSLAYAFAMVSAGAKAETRSEIIKTMHLSQIENYHRAFNKLERLISTPAENPRNSRGDDLIVRIANSSWGQKNERFTADFLDVLALNYGAAMNLVDFKTASESARLAINDWVADQTEEMITDLIPAGALDRYTRLVLTNAIYFYGNWLNQFDEEDTYYDSFHNLDGSVSSVPMMHLKETTQYLDGDNFELLIKPYQGTKRNAMYIFMADEGQLEQLESGLNGEFLDSAKQRALPHLVTLSMPKFEYSWKKSVVNYLKELGMNVPFEQNRADFSGITEESPLYISDVFHEAAISIDEKGTEASAATALIMSTTSIPGYATMNINRPFIYLIRNEDTGAILFMGKVVKL